MKRTKNIYRIYQQIKEDNKDYEKPVLMDETTNVHKARDSFNALKVVGDTNEHHHFLQRTYVTRSIEREYGYDIIYHEVREFTGMKGEQIQ